MIIKNKYNIGEEVYIFDKKRNAIIKIEISSITKQKDEPLKYNYFYNEEECFITRTSCIEYAKDVLQALCNIKINDLIKENKLKEVDADEL